MDLGAAVEGIAGGRLAGLLTPSLFWLLVCSVLAYFGWSSRERGFLVACLLGLAGNQALLFWCGFWQGWWESSWSRLDVYVISFAIVTFAVAVWTIIGFRRCKQDR